MKKSSDKPKKLPRVKFSYSDLKLKRFEKTHKFKKQDNELTESIEEMRLMRQGVLPKNPY